MNDQRVLVTGGAGFIGVALLYSLHRDAAIPLPATDSAPEPPAAIARIPPALRAYTPLTARPARVHTAFTHAHD